MTIPYDLSNKTEKRKNIFIRSLLFIKSWTTRNENVKWSTKPAAVVSADKDNRMRSSGLTEIVDVRPFAAGLAHLPVVPADGVHHQAAADHRRCEQAVQQIDWLELVAVSRDKTIRFWIVGRKGGRVGVSRSVAVWVRFHASCCASGYSLGNFVGRMSVYMFFDKLFILKIQSDKHAWIEYLFLFLYECADWFGWMQGFW